MSWVAPTLDDVKLDLNVPSDRDDAELTLILAAAISYVETFHATNYDFANTGVYPAVPAHFGLGIIRQVSRWMARRNSPDAMLQAADVSSRVPSWDADIENMLRMGRASKGIVA